MSSALLFLLLARIAPFRFYSSVFFSCEKKLLTCMATCEKCAARRWQVASSVVSMHTLHCVADIARNAPRPFSYAARRAQNGAE